MLLLIILSFIYGIVKGQWGGHIVGGEYANITDFPHSAFLTVECISHGGEASYFICGASIVAQELLLTAAHCLEGCSRSSKIIVNIGNKHRELGSVRSSKSFLIHELYGVFDIANDIGLVRLKSRMKLNKRIQKVLLMKKPPKHDVAYLAGWGLVDEELQTGTLILKSTDQEIWSRSRCARVLKDVPKGTFCAGSWRGSDFASQGDSGSALIVNDYIQIGLVSYKNPYVSKSLVVYTNVSYFYDWIKKKAMKIYCRGRK